MPAFFKNNISFVATIINPVKKKISGHQGVDRREDHQDHHHVKHLLEAAVVEDILRPHPRPLFRANSFRYLSHAIKFNE